MAVEFYKRLGAEIKGKEVHFPAPIDPVVNFDLQVREHTSIQMIKPIIQSRAVEELLPPSWEDTVLSLRLESVNPDDPEVIVVERKGGAEVELYQADETGLLHPVYPEDLPRVIRLNGLGLRLGLVGKKKGEDNLEFLNSVRHIPQATD